MEDVFPLEKNFCKIFKGKDNPELVQDNLPKYITSHMSKWSILFTKETYYKLRLCFLHNKTDHLFYFNYPNIETVDDYSLLFLLKLYRLYEILDKKIAFYNSPKNSVVLFDNKLKLDKLNKYLFILSFRDGKKYSIDFTQEENVLIRSIVASYELDYEDEKAKEEIFNRYLRESILTDDFYKNYVVGKKRNEVEKAVREYFNKLKKENPNFVRDTKKVFMIEYSNLLTKLNNFFKTAEYKKFIKSVVIKPFKFPMKEYFGDLKPLQYQFFKNLVDEFEKEVRKKLNLKK